MELDPETVKKLDQGWKEILGSHGVHEPDWGPLEAALPLKQCAGFMFMGYSGEIRLYKHGLTRHYLNLDPQGRAYLYDEADGYYPVPLKLAVDRAFEGLSSMGFKRSTPYDEKSRAKRHKLLENAGWTIVTLGDDGPA